MNQTAIKSALSSTRFRSELYLAMRKTAILKKYSSVVKNSKGKDCLLVRYFKTPLKSGFVFNDSTGKDITVNVLDALKTAPANALSFAA
jgi:hypothetical protein